MKPILGYWDLRGRANPIRMLLHSKGVDFEDKRYALESFADFEGWLKGDKVELGKVMNFPNLPYLIDGDVKISQTSAILRHLGRKYDLDGKTEVDKATIESLVQVITDDLWYPIGSIAYPPEISNDTEINTKIRKDLHDHGRKQFAEKLSTKLDPIAKFLGNKKFVAGDYLTYVDFILYDAIDVVRRLFLPKHVEQFPALIAYLNRMENLPGVKEYLASDSFKPMPICGPFALFGQNESYKPTE